MILYESSIRSHFAIKSIQNPNFKIISAVFQSLFNILKYFRTIYFTIKYFTNQNSIKQISPHYIISIVLLVNSIKNS